MSKVKKILAVVLSMAMIMGMSITSFAAETTNVVVSVTGNGITGLAEKETPATVKYLQIVEPDTSSTDGYAIKTDLASYFGTTTVADLITIAKGETAENANVTAGDLNSNKDLATILQSIASAKADSMTTAANASFTATQGGLYLITASKTGYTYAPMLVYVPVNSTTPIEATAKGETDQIIKAVADNGQSVAKGDEVVYTVTSNYPYFATNYTNPLYKITDTLTNATIKENSIQVSGAGDSGYTVTVADDKTNFVVDFTYNSALAGNEVIITYTAVVGEVSTTNPLKNIVKHESGTDKDAGPDSRTEAEVISNPVKLTFNKVDATVISTVLDGAEFSLYKGDATKADGTLVREKITGTNGVFVIDGLDAQESYYVIETKAPAGYKVVDTPIALTRVTTNDKLEETNTTKTDEDGVKVTVNTKTYIFGDDFHVNADKGNAANTIPNTKLSSLPSTGGIGTTIFTIGGCAIMIIAAFLFFRSRKKEQ